MAHAATANVSPPADSDLAGYLATWTVNGVTVITDQPVSLNSGPFGTDISYPAGIGTPPTPELADGNTVSALIKAVDTGGNASPGVSTGVGTVPAQAPGDPTINSFVVT